MVRGCSLRIRKQTMDSVSSHSNKCGGDRQHEVLAHECVTDMVNVTEYNEVYVEHPY